MKVNGTAVTWSILFLFLVIGVGLAARLLINQIDNFDAELALPMLAELLLPGVAVGIILSGIFSAIMSTTDSQILSCSAVLSEDFKIANNISAKRLSTMAISLLSLSIALSSSTSVFTLVVFAWSALASSIAPLVIVHALGKRPSELVCLSMMATGLITALIWRSLGLSNAVYECLPGILASLMVYLITYIIHRNGYFNNRASL